MITSVATDYYLNRPINLPALTQSVIFAVLSANVSTAIGNLFEAGGKVAAALKGWSVVAKAGAHAVAQGTLSWMQGGNFLSGALAGGFASISTDVLGGAIKKSGEFSMLRSRGFAMLTGTVSGGVGSVLGGGNFWVGAGQGLIVTTFNYLAHQIDNGLLNDNGDGDGPGKGRDTRGHKPAPKKLPGFPDAEKVKSKDPNRTRWRNPDGKILEWDKRHGDVEVYNKQGKHLGSARPGTGEMYKPPTGRTIDPIIITVGVGVGIIYGGLKLLDMAASRLMPFLMVTPLMMPQTPTQQIPQWQ